MKRIILIGRSLAYFQSSILAEKPEYDVVHLDYISSLASNQLTIKEKKADLLIVDGSALWRTRLTREQIRTRYCSPGAEIIAASFSIEKLQDLKGKDLADRYVIIPHFAECIDLL